MAKCCGRHEKTGRYCRDCPNAGGDDKKDRKDKKAKKGKGKRKGKEG